MTVNNVKLNNFRNIPSCDIFPSDGVNVIFGENAQGKTNILEGIWQFTGCKSFRGSKERELIKFGEDFSVSELSFSDNSREKKAKIIFGNEKKVFLNGVELNSQSELIGKFFAVIFSPSHLSLIKDGPGERRKFLDTALCQLKPKYAIYLKHLKQALQQRNSILKDISYSSELYDLLDSWDLTLAKYSAAVAFERIKYITLLSEYCEEIYSGISEKKENFSVEYASSFDISSCKNINDLYDSFCTKIKENRKEDIFNKSTSVGPHRDDLIIKIDGKSARAFGSQGQQRSCALALKLGEAKIIENITNEKPVALLDDVMSELDEKRQNYILNNIKDRQVFLTCCDPSQALRMCNGKLFYVKNGQIEEK